METKKRYTRGTHLLFPKMMNGLSNSKRPAAFLFSFIVCALLSVSYGQEVQVNKNFVIEADGTVRMDSTATVWNDIMVFPDATNRGGSNPPVWGTKFMSNAANTSQGVFLWMFSATQEQELYFTVQIPHDYKVGTNLFPHVHWTTVTGTPTGSNVVWGLEYTVTSVAASFPVTTTMVANTLHELVGTPTGTGQHLVTEFGAVDGAGLGISAVMICRLYRVAAHASDTFPNEVGLLGFDIHYEQDTQGSRQKWIK